MLIGAVLRFWNINLPDIAIDDALYSLRSIGYIDYVAAINRQSTPISWFSESQWWQYLSFHDAPPLVFWVQWLFFQIGDDNIFFARLPFVIAGLSSILAMYFLGKKLGGEIAGLLSAGFLTISNYAIWVSRIGYLDGFLILWIALSIYFFIKAEEKSKNYIWWGTTLAAGLLTKYTFLFMGPVFLLLILIWRKSAFRQKYFYLGILAIIILISPIIVYNFMMFTARGHLDAALSTLVGQKPVDFQGLTREKNIDLDIIPAVKRIVSRNFSAGIWIILTMGIIGSILNKNRNSNKIIMFIGLLFGIIMLTVTGPKDRFGVILLPFIAYLFSAGIIWVYAKSPSWSKPLISIFTVSFVLWELFFAVQTQVMANPLIESPVFLSVNRPIFAGYNNLENYVKAFYEKFNGLSKIIIFAEEPQLAKYQEKRVLEQLKLNPNLKNQEHLLVFDDRMRWFSWVWIFERRRLYESAPIHSIGQFLEKLDKQDIEFYTKSGLKDATFIVATEKILPTEENYIDDPRTNFISDLESYAKPNQEIFDHQGEIIFRMYRLPLSAF